MKVLVAGGGVAGAAAACLLGPDCVLVEREAAPHDKVCGEFISAEAVRYLGGLGLDLQALGAVRVTGVRVAYGTRLARAALPFAAFGLSRRRLDAALLERAAWGGAEIVRGHTVRRLEGGVAEVAGLGRFPGHAVFLATGKHDLRGARRTLARAPEELVGLKMHFALDPAEAAELASHVELVLFGAGYAGLQPVEGGVANVSLLIERAAFAQAGESWAGVQALLEAEAPHMRRRLRGARALLDRPVSVFRVPYGYVHAPGRDDEGSVFRLGDQVGVIPSFCGDGIAMALHSAFCAVDGFRRGSAAAYHARLRRDISGQVARAGLLYRLGRSAPGLVTTMAERLPRAIGWAARLTRIPDWALDLR